MMKKLLALLLSLCLCLSMLSACGSSKPEAGANDGFTFNNQETTEPVQTPATEPPVAESTEPPTEPEPTEPEPPLEDVPSAEELLVYTLTEEEVDLFYTELTVLYEMCVAGEDLDVIDEQEAYVEDLYEAISDQGSIASVLYYCDMADEELKQQHLDTTDIITEAYDTYMQTIREIYLLDTPANDVIFETWTEKELEMLTRYTSEVAELEKRNEEIVVEYQALSDSEMEEGIIPLYKELILNNNRIAQIYGFANYYEYAYEMVYERDYGAQSVEIARAYAQQYFPEAIMLALEQFSMRFQELPQKEQMLIANFMEGDREDLKEDYLQNYFDSLPAELRQDMMHMQTYDRAVYATDKDARDGAFTTTIGGTPICYYSNGYTGILTFAHEIGHYSAALNMELGDIPLDLAELHSQGNEWLFIRYMKDVLPYNTYSALRDYKLYMDMATITISFMVDEFEQIVYTDPNIANYTLEDFEAAADKVTANYGGAGFVSSYITDFQYYWRMVVMEQPIYYISYGVSDLAALNLYTISVNDQAGAIDIYTKLTRELDTEKGFQENLKDAGLAGPFAEDVYKSIYRIYSK